MSTLIHLRLPELVVGAFSTSIGLFVLADISATPAAAAKSAVGPAAFPGLVGFGLLAVGLRLLYEARARWTEAGDIPPLDLGAAALGAIAFAAMILTLEWLGWIVAGSLMYATVAWIFGSRQPGRSLLLGLGLTTATYLLFDYGLDLSLPLGAVLEPLRSSFFTPS